MAFGLWTLLEAALLMVNAICVLHEERFLAKSKHRFERVRVCGMTTSSFKLVVFKPVAISTLVSNRQSFLSLSSHFLKVFNSKLWLRAIVVNKFTSQVFADRFIFEPQWDGAGTKPLFKDLGCRNPAPA